MTQQPANDDPPRILVVGAGGIGGVLTGTLLAAGHPVELLCRSDATAAALTAEGYRLSGPGTPGVVPAGASVVRPGRSTRGSATRTSPSRTSCR